MPCDPAKGKWCACGNVRTECPEEMCRTKILVLAQDLHRHYRAMSKALDIPRHDHGWSACSKQKYFLRRAARELTNARKERTTPKGNSKGPKL